MAMFYYCLLSGKLLLYMLQCRTSASTCTKSSGDTAVVFDSNTVKSLIKGMMGRASLI